MNIKSLALVVGALTILYLPSVGLGERQTRKSVLLQKYEKAVQSTAVVSRSKLRNNLVAITPLNDSLVWNADRTKVLVVTWKSQSSYTNNIAPYTSTSSNEAYVIWVTAAPRIHDFCHNYLASHPRTSRRALNLRLKERLGLHPDWTYDLFVELWVSPNDLFRPCVDPDPTDTSCNLNFESAAPVVKNIKDYPAFYKNIYYNDFRNAPGVPWTGLGYTYDWAGRRRIEGESEFIIAPNSAYEIRRAVPTWDYCAQD